MILEFADGEQIFWPSCAATGCTWSICVGASNIYCYVHTLQWLLEEQIEAINRIGIDAPDRVIDWMPRNGLWVGDKEKMEQMQLALADMEVNYLDKDWLDSAREIIRRIKLPE